MPDRPPSSGSTCSAPSRSLWFDARYRSSIGIHRGRRSAHGVPWRPRSAPRYSSHSFHRLSEPCTPLIRGAGGFNLAAIWQQIAAFPQSTIRWLPALPATTIRPSNRVRLGRWRGRAFLENLKREYVELEQKWLAALNVWRTRTGVAAIEELLQELRSARDAYESLASEEKLQLLAYERSRRVRQLHAIWIVSRFAAPISVASVRHRKLLSPPLASTRPPMSPKANF